MLVPNHEVDFIVGHNSQLEKHYSREVRTTGIFQWLDVKGQGTGIPAG